MKRSSQRHSIENVFVLVLFAIFAMTIVAVYYQGKVYELFAAEESEMKPEDGVAIMDAKDLHFEKKGSLIRITSKDSEGRENETTVSLRSEESGVAL